MLGHVVADSTVAKYMVKVRTPDPSQRWGTFLRNHMEVTAACDSFVVPTATFKVLLHDRDGIYGWKFEQMVKALRIRQIRSAPRSPWQNPFAERVIGSIRRECTDHIIPFGRRQVLRVLREYIEYYNRSRSHQSLERNSPVPREVETVGGVCATPVLGGLHHRYFRAA